MSGVHGDVNGIFVQWHGGEKITDERGPRGHFCQKAWSEKYPVNLGPAAGNPAAGGMGGGMPLARHVACHRVARAPMQVHHARWHDSCRASSVPMLWASSVPTSPAPLSRGSLWARWPTHHGTHLAQHAEALRLPQDARSPAPSPAQRPRPRASRRPCGGPGGAVSSPLDRPPTPPARVTRGNWHGNGLSDCSRPC